MTIPTTLLDLAGRLRELLHPGIASRPFIADGSPFSCDVAIVGINPGTTTAFWDFWSDDLGFARASWVETYYSNPGARRNATRNRIERLVSGLRPLRVVELNAYPYATRTEAEITPEMRDASVLHLMLQVARPRAIFIFGRVPARIVGPVFGLAAPKPGTLNRVVRDGQEVLVFTGSHLSRGWSYDAVDQFVSKVKHELRVAV